MIIYVALFFEMTSSDVVNCGDDNLLYNTDWLLEKVKPGLGLNFQKVSLA